MLKRSIGLSQGVALAVGMVLGSGLFSLPGLAIEMGGPLTALWAWAAMMLMMVPMLFVFIKLGQAYPQVEGLSQYAVVAIAGEFESNKLGVYAKAAVAILLCGTFALGMPATAWVAAAYILHSFSITSSFAVAGLTLGLMFLSIVLNLRGIQSLSAVNTVSMYVLLLIIGVLVLINLDAFWLGVHHVISGSSIETGAAFSVSALWSVMALLFWAFLGWENMSFGLGELHDPQRNVPRVYGISFVLVCALYFILALVASGAAWQGRDVQGATGLLTLFSAHWMKVLFGLTLALLIVASMNSWLFGASRLVYATALDGVLPDSWAVLNDKGVPSNAFLVFGLSSLLSVYLLLTQVLSVGQLFSLVSQNFLVLYAVSLIAYWRLVIGVSHAYFQWFIALTASCSCVFLLQGFSWWLMYPVILMVLGVVLRHRQLA